MTRKDQFVPMVARLYRMGRHRMGRRRAVTLLTGLVATPLLCRPAAAQADQAVGRIEGLRGYAALFSPAGTRPAAVGGPVYGEDTLQTSSGAAVRIRLAHGATLFVGPDSRLEMAPLSAGQPGTVLSLVFGVVRAVVERPDAEPLSVEGRYAVASVRGTRFAVVQDDGQTSVVTLAGQVAVAGRGGDWTAILAPGDGIDVPAAAAEAGQAPPINRWGAPRIGRIVAMTTLR
jgi:ferric-dicitrate binding protein FerR (iron transport regulator)